jgi:signal peptidase I
MMGDNRDDSLDSRVAASAGGVGYVPIENLVGHAQVVVGSYDYIGGLSEKGLFERLRGSRFLKTLY